MGQAMKNTGSTTRKTSTGFTQTLTLYSAKNCEGCPLRGVCYKAKGNRTIEINHSLNHFKQQADERLLVKKAYIIERKEPGM